MRWFAVACVVAVAACSDGGGDAAPSTLAPTAPPDTVADAPGTGTLVLDAVTHPLVVTSCATEPTIDPTTGVTTVFVLTATAAALDVEVTRQQTGGAAVTTTDTITVAQGDADVVQAQRVLVNGAYLDLRRPGVAVALLDLGDDGIRGDGDFGPVGSVEGDPGIVEGTLTARCP